jgi:hypothetical protein
MISTFQALAVAVVAVLPGAAYMFAYEREAGAFSVGMSDRLVRFLAASAVMHALLSAGTYWLYRAAIASGDLRAGRAPLWAVEAAAVAYVALPTAAGLTVGHGKRRGKRWAAVLVGDSPEPRAWDLLWSSAPSGLVRARLKSGAWVGGHFSADEQGRRSYAGGFPEDGDLYLARRAELDQHNGTFVANDNGEVALLPTGLLVRWDEIEVLDITHDPVEQGDPA